MVTKTRYSEIEIQFVTKLSFKYVQSERSSQKNQLRISEKK